MDKKGIVNGAVMSQSSSTDCSNLSKSDVNCTQAEPIGASKTKDVLSADELTSSKSKTCTIKKLYKPVRSRYLNSTRSDSSCNSSDNRSCEMHNSTVKKTSQSKNPLVRRVGRPTLPNVAMIKNLNAIKGNSCKQKVIPSVIVTSPFENPEFHSTALNDTAFLDKIRSPSVFSSTVVGGFPAGVKVRVPTPEKFSSGLPELNNISVIAPPSSKPPVITPVEVKAPVPHIEKPVTEDDLRLSYLQYLSWAYLDIASEYANKKKMEELQRQISFLTQLCEEKVRELSDYEQKIQIVKELEDAEKARQVLSSCLTELKDESEDTNKALEVLSNQCENILHQIKVDNIYMPPEDDTEYKDSFENELKETKMLLEQLSCCTKTTADNTRKVLPIIEKIASAAHDIISCDRDLNKTAAYTLQEASLKISLKNK